MRILFVSEEFPPITDGIGAYVGSVTPALAARGHSVHVLSCMPGQENSDVVESGVYVHRRNDLRLPGLDAIVRAGPVADRLRRAITCWAEARRLGERFDVIEAPDWMAEGLLVRGAPIVAHVHTPWKLATTVSGMYVTRTHRAADLLERLAVRRACMVTGPSRLIFDSLRGWIPQNVEARVIRYPVDLEQWSGVPSVAETGPVVLSVGRLETRKGPEVLIEAAAALPGSEVVFVGRSLQFRDGMRYREWLERCVEEAGANCRFVDHVARHELPALYAQARVVAIPSLYDNFPMVGLEALASGRPLVCTDKTGTAELLDGSGAGTVVPAGDAAALAAALSPFLSDPEAAAAAGREARELVTAECSPARIAEQREACYADVIARCGRG